jgi:PTS system nitrogen regulatory IIA component
MPQDLTEILTPERAHCGVTRSSKKRVLEYVSELIADNIPNSSSDSIFECLLSRERLGSTGVGDGVAIPHCRLSSCSQAMGAVITLPEPIDFDAIDRQPVDIIFVLIVPKEACQEHLNLLGLLAERLNKAEYRESLRKSVNGQELYDCAVVNLS